MRQPATVCDERNIQSRAYRNPLWPTIGLPQHRQKTIIPSGNSKTGIPPGHRLDLLLVSTFKSESRKPGTRLALTYCITNFSRSAQLAWPGSGTCSAFPHGTDRGKSPVLVSSFAKAAIRSQSSGIANAPCAMISCSSVGGIRLINARKELFEALAGLRQDAQYFATCHRRPHRRVPRACVRENVSTVIVIREPKR